MGAKTCSLVHMNWRMKSLLWLLAGGLLFPGSLVAAPPLKVIVKKALDRYEKQEKDLLGWEYDQFVIAEALDDSGEVGKVHEMDFLVKFEKEGPRPVLVAQRGDPLLPQMSEKDQKKFEQAYDSNRNKLKLPKLIKFFDLTYLGEGKAIGKPAYIVGFKPKPGVETETKFEAVLTKMTGKVWLAKSDYSILQSEGRLMKPADLALFFAKLGELEFFYKAQKIRSGYAPGSLKLRFKVNVGLYEIHHRQRMTMKNYRKSKS